MNLIIHRKILTLTLATVVCLASACTGLPAAPKNSPTPGLSEGDIRTQAVETAYVAMTASAPLPSQTASVTPQPSLTYTLTTVPTINTPIPPTATRTVIPSPTLTYTPAQTAFSCQIISQNPGADIPTFETDAPFDLVVTVKNTGDSDWDSPSPPAFTNGVIFMFINGKYMQEKGKTIVPVPDTDKHHDAKVVVDLTAPDVPGTYTANYAMLINHLFFCPVQFTIKVK
jgi:archaellum component FlaG (FlaF/FlaG flagellin family)